MKKLIMSKWRSLPFFAAAAAILFGCFFLSDAVAKQQRTRRESVRTSIVPDVAGRSASYSAGNFSFSNLELTGHPASPAFYQADAEPEIITDVFGNIYVTAIQGVPGGTDLWKSTDKGASFVYMGQPDGAQDHCNPPLVQCNALGGGDDQIDVSSGGYLYVSSLWLGNITMSVSYDGGVGGVEPGQKWEVNPAAANLVSDDRQWVAAYGPQTLYMTFATTALTRPPGSIGLFMTKSTDGGKTFPTLVEITAATPLDTVNVESNLVVDPYTGNLYTAFIPNAALNVIKLASSTDGGATWNITTAYTAPAGTTNRGVFPILAIDKGGNLHLVFTNSTPAGALPYRTNSHVYLTSTADPSATNPTWLPAVQVDSSAVDPDTTTACEAWVVAGSPGVVNIAWLGTSAISTDQLPGPPAVSPTWHVFFSQTNNAMSGNPIFAQNKVESAVVHNRSICMNGLGCTAANTPHGEPGNRDLLEYFRMALDPEGKANIVYADSVNNCPAANCRTNTWYAKQTTGNSAYAPPPAPAAATFSGNIAVGSPGGEPGMKVDSHNCMFVTTPGNPWVWKSVNNGASFLPPVDPVSDRVLNAGDEDILPIAQTNGARPDLLYFVDLATLTAINVAESTDGGATWFPPGPGGAAGEVDASSDRQWIAYDRGVPAAGDLTVYEMDHEAAGEAIRFNALTNDGAWSPPASGITAPEMILPPDSTFPNTNPGPVFVDPVTHTVYGVFTASTIRTNRSNPPFGKLPNVWVALGPPPATAGAPPGPFVDVPVFKGVQDSPAALPSPAPALNPAATTYGSNTANDFPAGAIDSAGNIYVAWAMNNSRTNEYMVWMATSHDHGQHFYGPFQVSQGPGAAVMPWVAAGSPGRVDIAFYATTTAVDPNIAPNTVEWNTMFAQSLNGDAREPVFTVSQVSHHVMHKGPICNMGLLCPSGTRTLADFFQVAIGPDGLANIAYADNGPVPLPPGNPDKSQAGTHAEFARQASGPLALTNPMAQTCLALPSIQPVSAVSRKTHPGAGDFDVNLAVTGSPGIECRSGGANGDHTVLISFANSVTVGSASVASSDGMAMVSSFTVNGPVVTVNLTKVTNAQTITITLSNVSDQTNVGNVGLPVGILAGDTNSDREVNSGDISQTKSESGHVLTGSNFREDLNVDGEVNSGDISLVKSKSGTGL
jgi:hypothetical protein